MHYIIRKQRCYILAKTVFLKKKNRGKRNTFLKLARVARLRCKRVLRGQVQRRVR